MKRILIEPDDQLSRELERDTAKAYSTTPPMPGEITSEDLVGWDPNNALARPASRRTGRTVAL